MTTPEEKLIFKYFLGELAEEKKQEIELRVIEDPGFAEQVEILESELIEAYLLGDLTSQQIREFEENYLITETRLKRLQVIRNLQENRFYSTAPETLAEKTPRRQGALAAFAEWWRFRPDSKSASIAFASLCLITVAGFYLFWLFTRPMQDSVERAEVNSHREIAASSSPNITPLNQAANLKTEIETAENEKNHLAETKSNSQPKPGNNKNKNQETEPATENSRKGVSPEKPATGLAVILLPGGLRDSEAKSNTISLEKQPDLISLELALKDATAKPVRVELQNAEGDVLWSNRKLTRSGQGKSVKVELPKRLLAESHYVLMLFDETNSSVAEYTFKVKNK